ncbi:hypothetical protein MAPG_05765 [Magnaporthiopsis poae ATCC 64411]|uniref:Uncharacterized protein n=1 Tax=Magnaporthiopsis poae (strain ATCC 64411 / 73-15) TaxID=644358 RepID=A0A0C4E099_MAGP6|nr:hypothetical protein MAPG_05765 [Magnaporthiopsis poae ATCC 64411]
MARRQRRFQDGGGDGYCDGYDNTAEELLAMLGPNTGNDTNGQKAPPLSRPPSLTADNVPSAAPPTRRWGHHRRHLHPRRYTFQTANTSVSSTIVQPASTRLLLPSPPPLTSIFENVATGIRGFRRSTRTHWPAAAGGLGIIAVPAVGYGKAFTPISATNSSSPTSQVTRGGPIPGGFMRRNTESRGRIVVVVVEARRGRRDPAIPGLLSGYRFRFFWMPTNAMRECG